MHYMDSLRATAMFLGLVLHGAVMFGDWNIGFFRHHDESSLFVRYFSELIQMYDFVWMASDLFFGINSNV